MKFKIITLLLFVSLYGCTKEGPAGPAGKNGNANVVSSSITSSAWSYDDPSWIISFTYPAITQAIIDKGAVLVYIKVGNAYNQLPLTFYQSSTYSTTLQVSTFVGGTSIYWSDSDLSQPTNPGTQTFKIVVIAASEIQRDVDHKDYKAVQKAYNLSE